jgi:hypothetical protein
MMLDNRARQIVALASTKTRTRFVKTWLKLDEFGAWERHATQLLETTSAKAAELKMTEASVNDEIATMLAYLAAQTALTFFSKEKNAPSNRRARFRHTGSP